MDPREPAWPAVVSSTIRMNHRAALAALNSINGRIQHCVDEMCVGMSPNRPAHHQPVKAINDWRQVNLADRKSTRLNSSHSQISYAVFCLKKKKKTSQTDKHNK